MHAGNCPARLSVIIMLRFPTIILSLVVVVVVRAEPASQKCKDIAWTGCNSIEWPSAATKSLYKSDGRYIGKNVIATRAVISKDDAFLALPRYKPGVPFTLARMSLRGRNNCQTSLGPFPSWSMHEEGNCGTLQNVVDLFLDPQGVLWALDTGVVNSFVAANRTCSPKVVAINARSGKVVKIVDLSALTNDESHLQYVIADYSHDGRVFVYISDASNRALLIYDVTSGRGYRLILPESVALGSTKRDVLYIGLIRRPDGANFLLLSYVNSLRAYAVGTDHLQRGQAQGKIEDLGAKYGKIVFLGTDNGSAVFYRREGESDVYRWDLLVDPNSYAGVQRVYRGTNFALPTHVSVDLKRGKMRLLESNFPDFFRGTVGCGVNHVLRLF